MPEGLPPTEFALLSDFADHLALERRLSPNTVAAYRHDLGRWRSSSTGIELPGQRTSRSCAGSSRNSTRSAYARASIARRVGAIHTFYRWALGRGGSRPTPPLLLGRPKVVNRLPTVLRPREAEALVEAPPRRRGRDPLERRRRPAGPGHPRAPVRLRSPRGRGREPHRRPGRRGRRPRAGAGARARRSARSPSPTMRPMRSANISSAGRPQIAPEGSRQLFFNRRGKPFSERDIRSMVRTVWRYPAAREAGHPAYAAALVRHAPAGRRGRHQSRAGTARARERRDDAALHARLASPALRCLRARAPEGLNGDRAKKARPRSRRPVPGRRPAKNARGQDGHGPAARRRRVGDPLARFKADGRRRRAREADPALRAAREVRRQPCRHAGCPRASNSPTSCATGCSG